MDRLREAMQAAAMLPAIEVNEEVTISKLFAMQTCEAPVPEKKDYVELTEAREYIKQAIKEYVNDPKDEVLVIAGQPGIGKTWTGTSIAHYCVEEFNYRVFYIGPRHDFWDDMMQAVEKQGFDKNLWYHWWPREKGVEGRPDTCLYPDEIENWLKHGQQARNFCASICGINYVKHECVYWKQKDRTEPIIYGQHLHAVYGHPLTSEFDVVIGDEDPSKIFFSPLFVGAEHILAGLPYGAPLFPFLENLQEAIIQKKNLIGPALLHEIAGEYTVEELLEVVKEFDLEGHVEAVEGAPPDLKSPTQVNEVTPHLYIQHFLPILEQELETYLEDRERRYQHRFKIGGTVLRIIKRDYMNDELPKRRIWFDATADEILTAIRLGSKIRIVKPPVKMKGEVIQVHTRANNKGQLFHFNHEEHEDGSVNEEAFEKLKAQADTATMGYEKKAVITFKDIATPGRWPEYHKVGHFYANRGTNQFEDCDILVVAGTPRTPNGTIIQEAAALWDDEKIGFNFHTQRVDRPYKNYTAADGMGRSFPVGEFVDPRLTRLLWQYREAEIIQAAHRLRILFQEKPVVLLTNIPIDELPPTTLISERELLGAPSDIRLQDWTEFLDWANKFAANMDFTCINIETVIESCKVHRNTARKYLNALIEYGDGWHKAAVKGSQGKGRPPLQAEKQH